MTERWREIAEKITKEMDTEKLIVLSQELNEALAEKDVQQDSAESVAAA